jgi:hypothetical protein
MLDLLAVVVGPCSLRDSPETFPRAEWRVLPLTGDDDEIECPISHHVTQTASEELKASVIISLALKR